MKYLTNDCTEACRNMAFDDFALECLPLDEPVFFLWRNAPSGSGGSVSESVSGAPLWDGAVSPPAVSAGTAGVPSQAVVIKRTISGKRRNSKNPGLFIA